MQATVVFVVGLGDTAAALRRLAGDVDEVVKRLSEPGATAAIVPPAAALGNEVALSPREAFLGEAEQVRSTPRPGASRASRSPATRPASPRCCPGSGSPPRRSSTCASWPTAARGCTAPATRSSRPSMSSWRAHVDRSPEALAAVRREARLHGPADVRRRALHRGGRGARGLRRGGGRRADGRPRLRPPRRAPRAARDPGGELPARAAPGGQARRLRRAAGGRLRRRAGDPGRPGDLARRDRGDGRRGARRGRDAGRARRRPLDHRAVRARVRGRPRAGRDRPLRHPHGHRRGGLRRRVLARHLHAPHHRRGSRRREPLRADRPARLLAGRGGVRAGRPSAGSRACSCTTSATSASAR